MISIKDELVISRTKGKIVLQVGVFGDFERYKKNMEIWEFKKINDIAKEAIGIDIEEKFLKYAQKLGFKIRIANAESFKLNKKFDVIYAGDLIEHVSNVGLFLDSCAKHMNKNSELIITTPNPHSFSLVVRGFFGTKKTHPQHTNYMDKMNMKEVSRRYGLVLKDCVMYTEQTGYNRIRNFVYRNVTKMFKHLNEEQMFILNKK